ncbi:hypothetical protein BT93_L5644 [Corymbia citriodora subsp. variegata]|uniref:Uncharacterized protein n=1 Tax=Corymbia citriodora subsp. variegata TaxID=360336 RepID=A0A8T0CF25_CORYI|nr:hypothetical protein BT93_L5644 [Corymbia citriodora subsp. variegata]
MSKYGPVDLKKAVDYASLKDRNVVVTGGSSGFGKAFVHMFVDNGANVVLADVQDGPGQELEKELASKGAKVKFVHVDVTSFESQVNLVRQSLEFFPRNEIDIFVPCAGILNYPTQINPQDPAALADLKTPPEDLTGRVISVNLAGVWIGTMLVARYGMGLHKAAESSGKTSAPTKTIVLIASLAGYCGAEGSVEYTTSKFGVRGLLRGLRKHLAAVGVRINAVSPFYVDTPMTSFAVPVLKENGIPISTVEHVVEATARLATDEEAYGKTQSSSDARMFANTLRSFDIRHAGRAI